MTISDPQKLSVSVVMPFYNEEDYIPYSLKIVDKTLNGKIDYEIVLVNDGSSDRSSEIAHREALNFPNVRVVEREKNGGLGAALRTGFAHAQKDFIFYTDIDMPIDFEKEFWRILAEGRHFDLCYGQRQNYHEHLKRQIYSKGFNWLMRFFFNIQNPDINFAMKFIRREKLLQFELYSNGSFIDGELYLKSLFSDFKMKPITIDYQERIYGHSHLGNIKNIIKLSREFLWLLPELYSMSQKRKVLKKNLL